MTTREQVSAQGTYWRDHISEEPFDESAPSITALRDAEMECRGVPACSRLDFIPLKQPRGRVAAPRAAGSWLQSLALEKFKPISKRPE